jgi:acetyl esterase/lipase
MRGLPDYIRNAIREGGASAAPELNQKTKALFATLIDPPGGGVKEDLDVAYGENARQKLDVYRIDDGKPGKTAVVYIPGGGFTSGDKRQDPIFFGNVGRFFARRGMVGVCANYRLTPEFKWPTASNDVQSAVRWVKSNAARLGVDSAKIVIFGHSAGAAHVASYLFDPEVRGGDEVMAGVLASGMYAVRKNDLRANVVQYFGDDETTFERRSALTHVGDFKVPVFVALSEFDPAYLAAPAFEMARALTMRDGKAPPIIRLNDHNHFSSMCTFGTKDDSFSAPLLQFIADNGG